MTYSEFFVAKRLKNKSNEETTHTTFGHWAALSAFTLCDNKRYNAMYKKNKWI
jgi:hypothetical protein